MRKTASGNTEYPYTVTVAELQRMLNCGYATARKIGELSGAKVAIGTRRLYIVSKIERYLEEQAEKEREVRA